MPLLHDGSDESRSKNIATLVGEGKPEKQAVAIAYSIQRRARGEEDPEEVGKADVGPEEEENRTIRQNMKTPQAHGRHEFQAAKWTSGNGHPRCLLCGDEEPQDGMCAGIHGAVPTNGDRMAHIAKAEPTEAQKRAGNYPKTHWNMHGMRIAIENLAGTKRSGVDPKGEPWEVTMPYHYGYIKGTEGADGDHLDVAIGPLMDQGKEAHIINQRGPSGEFDEHKVFLGYPSREAAIHAFRAGRSDDPDDVMGAVITVPIDELKRWIAEGCLQEEAVLKAETTHVKAHYRVMNGKVVYVQGYDVTTHGEHPEATIYQRTVAGKHSSGTHTLRATDAEDRETIKKKAEELGVPIHHIKRSGANHHGRTGAYDVIHFENEEHAGKVHASLKGAEEAVANTPVAAPAPPKAKGKKPGPDKGEDVHGPDAGPEKDPAHDPVEDAELVLAGYAAQSEFTKWEGLAQEFPIYAEQVKAVNELLPWPEQDGTRNKILDKLQTEWGKRVLEGSMPATYEHLQERPTAEMDMAAEILGGVKSEEDLGAVKAALILMRKAQEAAKETASKMGPHGAGSFLGAAKTLTGHTMNLVQGLLAKGGSSAAKIQAAETWNKVTSEIKKEALERYNQISEGAMGNMTSGQHAEANDIITKGYPTPTGKILQQAGMMILRDLATGAGEDAAVKAYTEALDKIASDIKDIKAVQAYNEVDAAGAQKTGEALQNEGKTAEARNHFMLAAMAYHHQSAAAKALGKHEASKLDAELAQAAASQAHALGE